MIDAPDFILFAQHGWADTNEEISQLATTLVTPKTKIIAPNLGWLKTWLSLDDLLETVETSSLEIIEKYPTTPWRIIGHSLGGLIWLELLNKHPKWWSKINSLVLIASPVGGADIARIIDPLSLGIGIAKDLGKNRRIMADRVTKIIPTLVIAGNIDNGSDGTIPVSSTKLSYAHFVGLPGISHAQLKNHPHVVEVIQKFWQTSPSPALFEKDLPSILIERLQLIPGMTDAHPRDFERAQTYLTFEKGVSIRLWTNPLNVLHIFVANEQEECLYAGFVGWIHSDALNQALEAIHQDYYELVIHGFE
ncbi:serine aminopeptidase domain-containing protein [Crocosphaera sp. XPORK-15E]|uniref:serine aminopeptidase domain-containing protein n=1 Tax=Crocosphaera sp. XPORK-15E TaxID=3110247 RepID=UPI002B1F3692|nr:lysophospholipase [Crocosphaera sp. XPORK-15E]MEA5536544.1 lysophospholipase [Crocosphaera sp. XPORK-15E]